MTAMGRPSNFHPELSDQAHNYCLLGATNDELAEFFGVSPRTIDRWIAEHADFRDAVHSGRVAADARVARAMYGRAIGYDRTVERTVIVAGEPKAVTNTIHYPANVQAGIFWLRNRRRKTFGDVPNDPPSNTVNDLALLDAAGESVRHHDGD
jgi:hypothetical protein